MNITQAQLTYNHQVPCSDGTLISSYEINVNIELNEESFQFFFVLDEGKSEWGHSTAFDQCGNERPGLLSPKDFLELFSHPKVRVLANQVEQKLGVVGKCKLITFPEEEYSSYDFIAFHKLCKQIAGNLRVKAQVLTFEELGMCSYNAVKLESNGGRVFILCNDYQVSFTRKLEGYPITFINDEELASHFPPPYKVWSVEVLNSPFELSRPLTKWETYSIKNWKPQTQGDFLFNYWD